MHAIIIISLLYSYVHAPTMFTNMHAEASCISKFSYVAV